MEKQITTRLTQRFGIDHPVMLAPMDKVSGGGLAAAVTQAGGLGLIGGGYGDPDWVANAFRAAGNAPVGIGFITWSLRRTPGLLADVLAHRPAALMVSFGDAGDIVQEARAAGIPTIWQVQKLAQAEQALEARVDVIVVQGQEAGGHGMDRGLTALLPAVRDLAGPDQIVVAAGGIADGRGLAAALMLGADGVMLGTRFWASVEADGEDTAKAGLVAATGDGTLRSKVFDVARGVDWPWHYTGRVVENAFAAKWRDDIEQMKRQAGAVQEQYAASDPSDLSVRALIAGEAVDLITDIKPAAAIIEEVVAGAAALLGSAGDFLVGHGNR